MWPGEVGGGGLKQRKSLEGGVEYFVLRLKYVKEGKQNNYLAFDT